MSAESLFVSVPVAAESLDISTPTAYQLIARGEFPVPVVKIGGRLKVSRVMLQRYAAGEPVEASA